MLIRDSKRSFCSAASLAAAIAGTVLLAGCGEEPPPPPPVVVAPPKVEEPPPPAVTPIKELMARYDIDSRVDLPEDKAPPTDEQRVAVLKFFDAFARGNAEALKPMLSAPDQLQLEGMVSGDTFKKVTGAIARIRVQCDRHESNDCALAIFDVGGDRAEPQLWVYKSTGTAEFDSVATPPGILEKISGANLIAAWFDVLNLEMKRAGEPDEVIELAQSDRSTDVPIGADSAGESAPGSPGGMPGKRKPSDNPVKPPRPPGFGSR